MGGKPSKVLEGLWLGGADVLNNAAFFSENGITHVLSVCEACPTFQDFSTLYGSLHFSIMDDPRQDILKILLPAVEFIHAARLRGVVYVHCQAGISRSVSMTLAYLVAHLGAPIEDVFAFVAFKRNCASPNPGFRAQLARYVEEVVEGEDVGTHGSEHIAPGSRAARARQMLFDLEDAYPTDRFPIPAIQKTVGFIKRDGGALREADLAEFLAHRDDQASSSTQASRPWRMPFLTDFDDVDAEDMDDM